MEESWVVGRGRECDLVVDDDRVSKKHCCLSREHEIVCIWDAGSTNGTYLNGRRLRAKVRLRGEDVVSMGRHLHFPWAGLFQADRVLTLGKASDNDIVVDGPGVDDHHVRFLLVDDQIILEGIDDQHLIGVGKPDRKVRRTLVMPSQSFYIGDHPLTASQIRTFARPSVRRKAKPDESSTAPTPTAEFLPESKVKRQLIELEIITEEQWKEALGEFAGANDELPTDDAILQNLAAMPAAWSTPTSSAPLLTHFQIEQVLAGRAGDLKVQHYIIRDRLGVGGMGEVYLVYDPRQHRYAALKLLRATLEGRPIDESSRRRFLREARIIARLRHANIPRFYDFGVAAGMPFLVMEYVEGRDLQTVVEEAAEAGDPAPVEWVVDAMSLVCEVLQYAHEQGVVHRDVKPANILVTNDGRIVMLDLGLARLWTPERTDSGSLLSAITQTGTGIGTPTYMPPEQWEDATHISPATDIYSLGCSIFHVLTGKPPFEGSIPDLKDAHCSKKRPHVRQLRPEAPQALDDILYRMMAIRPDHRYQSMAAILKAMDAPNAPPDRKRTVLIAGIAFASLAVLIGAWRYFAS